MKKIIYLFEEGSSVIILGIICFTVLAQVLSRFVLKTPLSWTEELSRYSLIWLTFIAASLALRNDGHFTIDVIGHKLKPIYKKALKIFILLIMLIYCAVLFVTGIELLPLTHLQESPALDIHMSLVYLSVPIGFALMIIHLIVNLIKSFRELSGR
ncbi:MAG: TRAP transporter small permease [Elusimicrobiota bacterium]|jgi:TRAP-type C4-dicarboxylate transport system permease small subunit|nr:TRAP transporter small permease [Elusimicrobiota bacterium]